MDSYNNIRYLQLTILFNNKIILFDRNTNDLVKNHTIIIIVIRL